MSIRHRISGLSVVALAIIGGGARECAAQSAWQPSAGHTQIPLWPRGAPDARPGVAAETTGFAIDAAGKRKLAGGRPYQYIANVTQPTITVYRPRQRGSGAAIMVMPGGGYNAVVVDIEGTEACDWVTSRGMTCVLLKYRVPCAKVGPYNDCPTAHQDAQRAMRMVRASAARWQIDPARIGVLGFSAGAHMAIELSTTFDRRLYPRVDAADTLSSRPDFALVLYPGHVVESRTNLAPNPDVRVPAGTPPTFLVQAYDDPVDPVENSLTYFAKLREARIPAEMHLFATGGHAFGLRHTDFAITDWPQLAERWLNSIGMTRR